MKKWNEKQVENFRKGWSKVVAKAWADPVFKQKLLKEPKKVLQENGVEVAPEMEYKVCENTDKVVYLNLLERPAGEITEDTLRKVSAGTGCHDRY